MYRTLCVMALVALCAGLAHSFSWDIVVSVDKRLEFIDINGTLTHTENMTNEIDYISYDPVYNRVLLADYHNIYSFVIATKEIESLVRDTNGYIQSLAYDPVTELLFWSESTGKSYEMTVLNSIEISLKSKFDNNNKVNERVLILKEERIWHIALDSCGGFIYWTSRSRVHRARSNGSEREVVIDNVDPITSLTIDQHSQIMYFADEMGSIKSADLNGKNIRTINILSSTQASYYLTVSKKFMYWQFYSEHGKNNMWQIPKNSLRGIHVEPKLFIERDDYFLDTAANYNIEDITREDQNCETLKSLLPNNSVSTDVSLLCVHGTKVSEESRCECTQGYSGERCEVAVCHNYCLHGDCSASAEGQPKCRCNPGYSGERCELNVCQGYCFRGDCSASADGQPTCSCNAGYSGERCEVNTCQGYCLNNGICALSEQSKPLCRCTGHYEGERCDVTVFQIKCIQAISLWKDILNTDVTSDNRVKSSCASTDF